MICLFAQQMVSRLPIRFFFSHSFFVDSHFLIGGNSPGIAEAATFDMVAKGSWCHVPRISEIRCLCAVASSIRTTLVCGERGGSEVEKGVSHERQTKITSEKH